MPARPSGGNGGFIETSAARVNIAERRRVTTAAPLGTHRHLADRSAGLHHRQRDRRQHLRRDAVGAAGDQQHLDQHRRRRQPGNGDIFVNDAVAWTAAARRPR